MLTALAQVPHHTTLVAELQLFDDMGGTIVTFQVPSEQQTRFVPDQEFNPTNLSNVIRADSFVLGDGDPARASAVGLTRTGRADLANIAPYLIPEVRWVLSALSLSTGCEGGFSVRCV